MTSPYRYDLTKAIENAEYLCDTLRRLQCVSFSSDPEHDRLSDYAPHLLDCLASVHASVGILMDYGNTSMPSTRVFAELSQGKRRYAGMLRVMQMRNACLPEAEPSDITEAQRRATLRALYAGLTEADKTLLGVGKV